MGEAYKAVETKVERAVHLRFGLPAILPHDWHVAIKKADSTSCIVEAVELAGFSEEEARKVFGFRGRIPRLNLIPWEPELARARFLAKFEDLRLLSH